MSLPNQLELQTLFSGFLFETGLSAVSVKNYLSDLRHFFSFCASISTQDNTPSVQEIFQSISKYLNLYLTDQKKSFTPQNTINRRSASIRRFSTFLAVKFGLVSSLQEPSEVSKNTPSSHISPKSSVDNSLPTISKILEHFRVFLVKEKKSHSTVKNYISDLNHFFAWSANETPFLDQNLENILSESHLSTYVTYLRLSHTSASVINRRQSSIKQFTRYCFLQKYIPTNPFEYKRDVPRLLPLSWIERFSGRKNIHIPTGPENRLATLYHKYNSLPFTPYLHLAILVLATSAMVIFGYNQIIKQAAPSSAALPTVPRRQLSFQGRLTDSSATPITTQVDVVFKLFNDPSAGSELYTSGTCQITPDSNGIFNTLIGGGSCGTEIASTVFTENRDVYLEVSVGAETLTPRQQIATVGYALNSETLQGYPASGSATINTVPIVDSNGDINIAAPSPSINSTSGTFNLNGQALTLTTTANSGGNIVLQPDSIGGGQVQVLGSTTTTDTLRIENANLTSGALISGYIGNDTATGRLLSLTAGSTETDRFYVAANGQVMINTAASLVNAGLIIDQNGSGDLFTASASGTSKFTIQNNGNILATGTLTGLTGLTVASGTVSLPNGEINNAEISELDWTKLQNYPTACPVGQVIQTVGDTLTCVAMTEQLWQRTSGSLAPLNITDSINLGATATSSALVHLAGTTGENSWINTGNFGIGTTNPQANLDIQSISNTLLNLKRTNDSFDNVWSYVGTTWTDLTTSVSTSGSTTGDVLNTYSDYVYIGKSTTFTDIFFDFGTILSTGTTRTWEYSTGTGTWATLPIASDGTIEWSQDGVVNFSSPIDWVTSTVNGVPNNYWIRVSTTTGQSFSTEPTIRLCLPSATTPSSVAEIYALGNDTLPSFVIDRNGGLAVGYADASTYRLRVAGSIYGTSLTTGAISGSTGAFSGTVTHTLSSTTYATSLSPTLGFNATLHTSYPASAIMPVQFSPAISMSSEAWNGGFTKTNAFDLVVKPTSSSQTSGKLVFKTRYINDIANNAELMNLTSDGVLNVLGRAQNPNDMFDQIFHVVSATNTWTDDTAASNTFGLYTGDILNVIGDYFYVGKYNTFEEIYLDFNTLKSSGGIFSLEYWDGSNWTTLPATDGTAGFTQDGSYTFTAPIDWAPTTVNNVPDLYWARIGVASGTFTTEPTLRWCLPSQNIIDNQVLSNQEFDGSTGWNSTGDWAYTTNDYTFTYSSGIGTLYQEKADFEKPANPNSWYRLRFINGVAGPQGTVAWIGTEFAEEKTYFTTSTTEVDVYFKSNSNPQDFVIYTTAGQTSGFRLDGVSLVELSNGDISVTGLYTGGGTSGLKIDINGNVGIGLTNPNYKLDVTGDFNLTGALYDNGSAGTAGQILSTTGTGVEWIDAPTGSGTNSSPWDWDTGVIYPFSITDAINLGNAATASATVHLAGVAGDNSFINTGNFGIGLTNPGSKLTVVGTVTTSGGNISLNNDSNYTTNINTGTSTGAVTIGGGSNTVAVNSSSWDVSTSGAASGFTGISSSGDIDFASLAAGGLVKAAVTTGRLSIASAGTDYEVPLTFSNGLTRSVNTVTLGGTLTANTDIPLAGFNLAFSGTGNVGIGLTNPAYELDVVGDINITGSYLANGAPLTASNWQRTDGSLAPLNITDSFNLGSTATSSALVHLAGTTDENSWINTGNFGIGLTNPTYDLDVTGDINLTGAIYDNGSAGTSGQVLSSTGTGVEWIDAPTSGGAQYWQWNGGVLSPTDLNDSVTLGATSTASATVHLAGKTGVNSFINTGNFGIGLTNPTAGKLQVAGGNIIVDSTYGLDTVGAGTLALGNTNATTINVGTSALARTITLGNSTGATSVSLNGGTGNSVNVGTNAIAHTVTVGNVTGATAVNVNTGTGGTTYTTTNGIFTLNTGTGSISLGTDAAAKNITLGNATGATALALNSGTGDISLTSTDQIKLSSSKAAGATTTEVFSILSSVDLGASDELLQIGDSATNMLTILGNGNVGIGNVINPGSTLTVNGTMTTSGGNISLNNDSNFTTNINTGTSTGAVTIGGGSNTVAINSSSWDITTLGVASGFTGLSSSGDIDFASLAAGGLVKADVTTGRLGIASAGTDYEVPLTFQNGLTRAVNTIEWGGTLVKNTSIDQAGYDIAFSGIGNFGIGLTNPTQKFQVGNFFVVDTANSRIGIGTTTPTSTLEIAGASSVISNTTGDITFNSASGLFDFSNGSLTNFLNATASGQIRLGNFTDAGQPTSLGTGSLIYSTTQNNPQFFDGSSWINLTNYFDRLATGTLYPKNWYDSINIGASTGNGASSSATVRISGDATNSSFFVNPVAFGFRTDDPSTTSYIKQPRTGYNFAIETQGGILPRYTGSDLLGYENHEWAELHLSDSIVKGGLGVITLNDLSLNTDVWHATAGFKVGTGAISAGIEFEVTGDANITQTLSVGGQVTVGGGAGKMDVGTVDPPYTIDGNKYATYMASMIGIKEETVGKVTTTTNDYIDGLGYRTLIDLDQQPVGSDIWLFSQTTNIQAHIGDLSVLLTPEGQAKAWYEVDTPNKILAIYSSTPTNISYRLTAPRFDSHRWLNTRTSGSIGHQLPNSRIYTNTDSIFDNPVVSPELIAKIDGSYQLMVNGVENKEVSTFMNSIVANLKVGAATAISLITDNLTVRTKLISPIADIDQLKVIDATVSGTLYADNIKGQTVDNLNTQINLLDEKYSSASAILADLQAKYGTYASLFGATSSATVTNDPLALSPLADTTPIFPSDLALNSLNVHTLIANDLLANGSIFTQSISAFDTDLYIQPTGDKLVNISNNLMILYPNGKIVINGDLLVAGNVLAQGLTSETATVSGTLAIGSSSISTESANFAQLTTGGLIIASGNDPLATISGQTNSNTTIGEATITAGTGGISILNNKVTPTTLIYITPTSDTEGRVLYVKSKTEGVGFTVGITGNVNNPEISFNYWLVETK